MKRFEDTNKTVPYAMKGAFKEEVVAELNKEYIGSIADDIKNVLVSQEKGRNLTDMKNWEEIVKKIYDVENRTKPKE